MQKMTIIVFAVFSLLAAHAQGAPAQQPQPSDGEKAFTYFAQATINWEKASTPGMRAEVILLKRSVEQGQNVVAYKMKVTGASRFQKYTLISWPITYADPITVMDGLMIDANGAVGCPAHSNDTCSRNFDGVEIRMKYAPARGEIYRNALISKDQKSKIFFSIVPDPIISKDAACSLEIIRLQPSFELVLVSARGFQPSEPVAFHSNSAGEIHDVQAQANEKGQFWVPFTPFVEGKTTGSAEVTARGKKCAPSVSFNWGAGQ